MIWRFSLTLGMELADMSASSAFCRVILGCEHARLFKLQDLWKCSKASGFIIAKGIYVRTSYYIFMGQAFINVHSSPVLMEETSVTRTFCKFPTLEGPRHPVSQPQSRNCMPIAQGEDMVRDNDDILQQPPIRPSCVIWKYTSCGCVWYPIITAMQGKPNVNEHSYSLSKLLICPRCLDYPRTSTRIRKSSPSQNLPVISPRWSPHLISNNHRFNVNN